jgi:hypothetical protein
MNDKRSEWYVAFKIKEIELNYIVLRLATFLNDTPQFHVSFAVPHSLDPELESRLSSLTQRSSPYAVQNTPTLDAFCRIHDVYLSQLKELFAPLFHKLDPLISCW